MEKIKIPPEQPMMIKAKRLAKSLYNACKFEEKRGENCGKLLLQWIKECYWGIIVKEHLLVFDEIWWTLHERKHTKKNKFIYGDDVGIWIEYPKNKNKRVVVSERYCSCADDNIHIFIYDKSINPREYFNWDKFRVVTVWHRQINNKLGIDWGDDRNIDLPSLNTYRKRDFRYGYYDCRDKGHCLLYEAHNERVENAHWNESRIEHALWTLRGHKQALKGGGQTDENGGSKTTDLD